MKDVFPSPQPDKRAGRQDITRYWAVLKTNFNNLGDSWSTWSERGTQQLRLFDTLFFNSECLYILDLHENKVLKSIATLRDLHTIKSRAWPLKDRMLVALNRRKKGKKVGRKLQKFAKELG